MRLEPISFVLKRLVQKQTALMLIQTYKIHTWPIQPTNKPTNLHVKENIVRYKVFFTKKKKLSKMKHSCIIKAFLKYFAYNDFKVVQ